MKKVFTTLLLLTTMFVLSSCTSNNGDNDIKTHVLNQIQDYIDINYSIQQNNDTSLLDVEEDTVYVKDDFFNYDAKDTRNVELEYNDFYAAFSTLVFIKEVINEINDFEYNTYYEGTVTNEKIIVKPNRTELIIEYFEFISELDVIMRHTYRLDTVDEKALMIKYLTVYDTKDDEYTLYRKMIVKEDESIESYELFGTINSFTYIYNSLESQEYFKYKGTMLNDTTYERETVEYYIPDSDSFVSYDIKDFELEDYRVKVFENGHRILKLDVNIFKSKEPVTEITWNLLSVDEWDSVEKLGSNYYIYKNNLSTMNDYELEIQLNGYGKITAYREIEGFITEGEVSLNDYGLESNIDLTDINNALTTFRNTYVTEVTSYGFTVTDEVNLNIFQDVFLYLDEEQLAFDEYIEDN